MKKKIVLWIGACSLLSVGVVITLILMSGILKDQRNSFLRIFPPHPVLEGDTLNIGFNSYYIAGGTKHVAYLGNSTAPLHLLSVNLHTLDTQHIALRIPGIYTQRFWSAKVVVDSPYYYLVDGVIPAVYRGTVGDGYGDKFLKDSIYFREFVPISPYGFVVKSISGSTRENILGRVSTSSSSAAFFTDQILQKQLDGIFCTDGMLRYNAASGQLIYLYYYRNQYLVIDSLLQSWYVGNTIDTNHWAKITTASYASEKNRQTHTLSSPPNMVNKRMDISNPWLFVESNLMAHNEHNNTFTSNAVIDVYDFKVRDYRFSFYLYPFKKKRVTGFRVFEDRMVVLYGDVFRVFSLRQMIFSPEVNTD